MLYIVTVAIFILLSVLYYFQSFGEIANYQILLTISTFLFSIFTGFFISRQGKRYSEIRNQITQFDGSLSNIYRQCGHLGKSLQNSVKKIIKKHYTDILKNHAWDYNFTHKSNTITGIHNAIEKTAGKKSLPSIQHLAVSQILGTLGDLQTIRKNMISLHNERIPIFQWVPLVFLAVVLFATLSVLPSSGLLYHAIMKGAFASAIIFVFILLRKFDKLDFFEPTMGEDSAEDVLNIFAGKK